eukprot:m.39124 g.39124  ORF g.39124 m.39124 type:complete len:821 (+) comp14697_c0_seq1:430-2892(+)
MPLEQRKHSFLALATAGQTRLQQGDRRGAVPLYIAALKRGTDDESMRSVVHSQLGNCLLSLGMCETAIQHHQSDLDIVMKLDDTSGTAKSWSNLGNAYHAKGDFPEAVRCFEQQLLLGKELVTTDASVQTKALANMGHTYQVAGLAQLQRGQEKLASELLCRARDAYRLHLKLSQSADDIPGVGHACGCLGNLFEKIESPSMAVPFYKRRLTVAQTLNDTAAVGRAHCNLGNVYRKMKKLDKAIHCYEQDLKITEELNDKAGEAVTCGNLGSAYQASGNAVKTVEFLERQVALCKETRDSTSFLRSTGHLARVYATIGNFADAARVYQTQSEVARAVNDNATAEKAAEARAEALANLSTGTRIDATQAAAALGMALDQEEARADGGGGGRHKWTLKGTMGKVFGRKFRERQSIALDTFAGTNDGGPSRSAQHSFVTVTSRTDAADGETLHGNHPPKHDPPAPDTDDNATTVPVVMRRKSGVQRGMLSRVRRLSSMFRRSPNKDDIYLPSEKRGSVASCADDDLSSLGDDSLDDFGFDELVFTLTQLQSDASDRQATDLEQLGQSVIRGTRRGKSSPRDPPGATLEPISHRTKEGSPDVCKSPEDESEGAKKHPDVATTDTASPNPDPAEGSDYQTGDLFKFLDAVVGDGSVDNGHAAVVTSDDVTSSSAPDAPVDVARSNPRVALAADNDVAPTVPLACESMAAANETNSVCDDDACAATTEGNHPYPHGADGDTYMQIGGVEEADDGDDVVLAEESRGTSVHDAALAHAVEAARVESERAREEADRIACELLTRRLARKSAASTMLQRTSMVLEDSTTA